MTSVHPSPNGTIVEASIAPAAGAPTSVAEPDGDGGRLVVRWGDRALSVPFRVE